MNKKLIRLLSVIFAVTMSFGIFAGCKPPGIDYTVDSITLSKVPSKKVYLVGEEGPDLTDGKFLINYKDGNVISKFMTDDDVDVTGFSSATVGKVTLTVTYEEKTCTFDITVRDTAVMSISITTPPTKNEYEIGELFNPEGGIITVVFEDETESTVSLSSAEITGFDSSKIGVNTLTAKYKNKTCTFTVEIKEKVEVVIKPEPAGYGADKRKAADFTLTNVRTGKAVSLSDYYGIKPVFITFWGWYCDPCKNEMPFFDEVYKEMLGKFQVLAVHVDEYNQLMSRLDTEFKFSFPILDDQARAGIGQGYSSNPAYIPANYMVDMWGYLYNPTKVTNPSPTTALNAFNYSTILDKTQFKSIIQGAMTRAEIASSN